MKGTALCPDWLSVGVNRQVLGKQALWMLLTLSKAAAKQHLFTELPGKLIKVKRSNFCPAYYILLGKTKGKNWVHMTFASELINAQLTEFHRWHNLSSWTDQHLSFEKQLYTSSPKSKSTPDPNNTGIHHEAGLLCKMSEQGCEEYVSKWSADCLPFPSNKMLPLIRKRLRQIFQPKRDEACRKYFVQHLCN